MVAFGLVLDVFLLTPLREGRHDIPRAPDSPAGFLLTPLREGRLLRSEAAAYRFMNFYSRPCGRGDSGSSLCARLCSNFYSRPCGRGDPAECYVSGAVHVFLLTPLREGRHHSVNLLWCLVTFLLTPLREGRQKDFQAFAIQRKISTHAPAGGATQSQAAD